MCVWITDGGFSISFYRTFIDPPALQGGMVHKVAEESV